jgi:Tfp pilus assembly protein PilN
MSQWINLYRDGLKPREYSGALPRWLLITTLLLVGVLGWGLWARVQANHAETQRARLVAQQAALQARIAELSAALAKRQPDPAITAALQRAQQAVEGRLWLAGQLQVQRSTAPMSPVLLGLARQRADALWLTHIEADARAGSLRLAGRTVQAEAVPLLVQRLASEPAFAGRSFAHFQMQQPSTPEPWLMFELATRCAPGSALCAAPAVGARP